MVSAPTLKVPINASVLKATPQVAIHHDVSTLMNAWETKIFARTAASIYLAVTDVCVREDLTWLPTKSIAEISTSVKRTVGCARLSVRISSADIGVAVRRALEEMEERVTISTSVANSQAFVKMVHVETLEELIYATVTRDMNEVTMERNVKIHERGFVLLSSGMTYVKL